MAYHFAKKTGNFHAISEKWKKPMIQAALLLPAVIAPGQAAVNPFYSL